MALFLQFLAEKWYLAGPWLVMVVLYFMHERKRGGASVSPAQLTSLVNREDGVVVDLRDSADYRGAHIVGSVNVPYAKFAKGIDELEQYKEKPIILVCKMGQHAGAGGKLLAAEGFTDINRLNGGMMEWQNMQLPLVK